MRGGGKFKAVLTDLVAKVAVKAVTQAGVISPTASYPDGTKVAQVAAWNEFGTERIPPRPFFRQTVAENSGKWRDQATHLLKANHYNVKLTLQQMGEQMRDDLVQTIIDGGFADNSEVTKLLKSRFPLGQVQASDYYRAINDVKKGKVSESNHDKPLIWSGIDVVRS